MSTRFEDDLAVVYADALRRLTRLLHAPGAPLAGRERVRDALLRLHRAYANAGMKGLEERAAELNAVASALSVASKHAAGILPPSDADALRAAAQEARQLLVRAAREAFPGEAARVPEGADPDAIATDLEMGLPQRSGSSSKPDAPISAMPLEWRDEYKKLFDTCIIRPEKLAKVNWYARKLFEFQRRYRDAGDAYGIPWWFVGAIHALEAGFAFDRHLHNGDPLAARTKRVPAGRPERGNPPFTWEQSAEDALTYMKLDVWRDWSVPGALFQWETYNGFGYRKFKIHSPYLWSFSNHYDKGRYVRDHVFDTEAESNQCGAATLLRVLANSGAVVTE